MSRCSAVLFAQSGIGFRLMMGGQGVLGPGEGGFQSLRGFHRPRCDVVCKTIQFLGGSGEG